MIPVDPLYTGGVTGKIVLVSKLSSPESVLGRFVRPIPPSLLRLPRNVTAHPVRLHPLPARPVPPPPSRLRSTWHRASWCRPYPRLAASPPPPRPCPDPPRAPPCTPDACARPSSSQSAHPRRPDSSTPCSTSASCACDPTAPGLPASAS